MDYCERVCNARQRWVSPTSTCVREAHAFCMTWVDGASGEPSYYCAPSRASCEDIRVGHANGKWGEKPAKRVSTCQEVP
jgi:hypothetical protein